jgi:hypothetical protein
VGFDEFDEEGYLRANPDVAVMVSRGLFQSPRDHWDRAGSLEHANGRRRSGFFEHDRMYDEETYLLQNPDVRQLVRGRALVSGYEHWMRHGRVEFSRGKRHGPFVATKHALRTFRVSLGEGGVLVVGAAGGAPEGPLSCRHGDDEVVPVEGVAVSPELRIVDVCHREAQARLVLVRARGLAGLDGKRPRPITVSTADGAPFLVARDAGVQAFSFAGAPDANAFLKAALEASGDAFAGFRDRVTDFAITRLHRPRDAKEPFSGLVLESLARREGGFVAKGWLAPASDDIASVVVWCPESGEHAELGPLTRIARPDVRRTLGEVHGIAEDSPLGFEASLPLPRAVSMAPRRFVFAVTLRNGVPRWFDCRGPR